MIHQITDRFNDRFFTFVCSGGAELLHTSLLDLNRWSKRRRERPALSDVDGGVFLEAQVPLPHPFAKEGNGQGHKGLLALFLTRPSSPRAALTLRLLRGKKRRSGARSRRRGHLQAEDREDAATAAAAATAATAVRPPSPRHPAPTRQPGHCEAQSCEICLWSGLDTGDYGGFGLCLVFADCRVETRTEKMKCSTVLLRDERQCSDLIKEMVHPGEQQGGQLSCQKPLAWMLLHHH
ncbi:hypothetical protein FQA47_011937 [Oryzias melastigma]|uniref:Uncharacterized protein n=1 Tax=Oryzias melastigma TaxID=30732 RepID=A0A834CDA3_ORYME|nr:hypothetical protein FQA47_011937 [Oryzias melastigma]